MGYNFTHMPTQLPLAAATIVCLWGRTVDTIKHAKFRTNQFRGLRATRAKYDPSPLT